MLNILEGYDIAAASASARPRRSICLAEVLKIAFADRAAASGDPDFVKVPVERLTSKAYAERAPPRDRSERAQSAGAPASRSSKAPTPRT